MIKTVYVLNRGSLNALAIYSIGMVGSLYAMLHFRSKAKFKISESSVVTTDFNKLRKNGISSLNRAALLICIGSYFIFWNTFPDSVAVYNPFRAEIGLRGVTYKQAFFIFAMAYLIVLTLIRNSLWFTGPKSKSSKDMHEFSKVCFSMNVVKADYWAYQATIIPVLVFFCVILIAYTYANAFGVSLTYLGVITFYQMMQFFQNFKHIHYFYIGILMAGRSQLKVQEENGDKMDDNFAELIIFCKFYGKFSNGVSLFINKIMCFTILVDSFNMHIVDHINLIDPYYLIGMVFGCTGLLAMVSLDLMSVNRFVQYFIHRVRIFVAQRYKDDDFEPPIDDISQDLIGITFYQQMLVLYVPVRLRFQKKDNFSKISKNQFFGFW